MLDKALAATEMTLVSGATGLLTGKVRYRLLPHRQVCERFSDPVSAMIGVFAKAYSARDRWFGAVHPPPRRFNLIGLVGERLVQPEAELGGGSKPWLDRSAKVLE